MRAHREFVRTVLVCLGMLLAAAAPAAQKAKGMLDPDKVPRVQPAELQRLMARNQVLLIDVRSEQAFAAGHLDGALHVPAREIEARASTLRKQAGSRQIVLYCSCPFEHTAAEAAVALTRLGLRKVSVLAGGYRSEPR